MIRCSPGVSGEGARDRRSPVGGSDSTARSPCPALARGITLSELIRASAMQAASGPTAETEARIRRLGLGDRVMLRPGYVDAAEVPALFAAADALVLPYRSATSSANVFLAYQHGVPVIATQVGDMTQQVRDGESGLLCPPEDPEALAAVLRRPYAEPGLLVKLRAGARGFDTDALWSPYVCMLEEALANPVDSATSQSGKGCRP